MLGDGWEDYLEGRERIDLIKTARPQWMNLNISDAARLDALFDHTGLFVNPYDCVDGEEFHRAKARGGAGQHQTPVRLGRDRLDPALRAVERSATGPCSNNGT